MDPFGLPSLAIYKHNEPSEARWLRVIVYKYITEEGVEIVYVRTPASGLVTGSSQGIGSVASTSIFKGGKHSPFFRKKGGLDYTVL